MSDKISDPELPNDYIIPPEYYDRYRLIFSHYQIDRKIGRIGLSENQRRKAEKRRIADSCRSFRSMDEIRYDIKIFREADFIQQLPANSRKVSRGQHMLN